MARLKKLSTKPRTNLTIDAEIKREARLLAYERGMDLTALVEKLLARYNEENRATSDRVPTKKKK
jgi:antitoxin component of RelBE/YafQ-DinJ toxin-antitoxin module